MAQMHVADNNKAAEVEGGLRMGVDRGLLVDGDLTSASNARTNVTARVQKLHSSEQTLRPRINASIDSADQFVSGYTSSSTAANFENIVPNQKVRGRAPRF